MVIIHAKSGFHAYNLTLHHDRSQIKTLVLNDVQNSNAMRVRYEELKTTPYPWMLPVVAARDQLEELKNIHDLQH